MTQYVEVKFRPDDVRGYTYANDGEPVKVGEFVKVDARGSEKVVEVTRIVTEQPLYECKPVLGKAERPASWEGGND